MLKSIYIKNFAIIEELELNFHSGLNILTGETGAGKSIIIDAISLAFGERASSEVVRKNSNKTIIECVFDISKIKESLNLSDFTDFIDNDELIFRREIPSKGNSRSFLNDTPISTSKLREISDMLVDFLGQYEHQTLLKSINHLKILDEFANNTDLIKEYQTQLKELTELIYHLKEYKNRREELFEKKDEIKNKLNLILQIDPKPNEDEDINTKLKQIENAEFLTNLAFELYSLIYNSETSCYQYLNRSKKLIDTLSKYESRFLEFEKEISSISISLKEFASFVKDFLDSIDFNAEEIEQMRQRYADLKKLIRQFGSIEDALLMKEKLSKDIELIDKYEFKIEELKSNITAKSKKIGELVDLVEKGRQDKAKILSSLVVEKLKSLGIENSKFEVKFDYSLINDVDLVFEIPAICYNNQYHKALSNGISQCEFLISTNPGYDVQPLKNVASGGEISRIMLAIKSIIANFDKMPLLIFDEIDTGISGKIAQKVALELKNLAKFHQVIAITHLPQVAAAGERNFVVEKIVLLDDTFVKVKQLNEKEKIYEIAKLLSGEKVTESSVNNAAELIKSVAK